MANAPNICLVCAEQKHNFLIVKFINKRPPFRINHYKKMINLDFADSMLENQSPGNSIFIIMSAGSPIGLGQIMTFDRRVKAMEIDVYVEGAEKTKAEVASIRSLTQRCIEEDGASRVSIKAVSGDADYISAIEAVGFKPEVRMRQHYFHSGKLHHVTEFGMLATSWLDICTI